MAGGRRDAKRLRHPAGLLVGGQVAAAEVERVLTERVRHEVEVALQGEEGGQHPLAAQWARGRPVGEGGLADEPEVRDAVEGERLPGGGAQERLAARRVGPCVDENAQVQGSQAPVVQPGPQPHRLGGAGRGDRQLLFTGEGQAGGPPRPQSHERAQVLGHHVGLAPEAAAHLGLDDEYARGGDGQAHGEGAPHLEGRLGGGAHHEAPVFVEPGDHQMGLHGRRLGGGDAVDLLEHAMGLRERELHVAEGGQDGSREVARRGRGLVDRDGTGQEGRLRIEHGGERLVLRADRVRRAQGELRVLGRHHRNPVAHEADDGVQPGRRGGSGGSSREVFRPEDRHHPRKGARARGVDAKHPGVGVGRAHDPQVEQAGDAEVARERAVAGDALDAHPRRAAASTASIGFR